MASVGLLILRLGVGGYMVTHGAGKLSMTLAGQFDQFGDPIGVGNALSLILATSAEFLCALFVMAGFFTRFAAAPVAFTMGVAALIVHGKDPWTMKKGAEAFFAGESERWSSKEPALLFLFVFLALIFTGAGQFSVDELIRRARRRGAKPA
jgi:putative oxidoreductase